MFSNLFLLPSFLFLLNFMATFSTLSSANEMPIERRHKRMENQQQNQERTKSGYDLRPITPKSYKNLSPMSKKRVSQKSGGTSSALSPRGTRRPMGSAKTTTDLHQQRFDQPSPISSSDGNIGNSPSLAHDDSTTTSAAAAFAWPSSLAHVAVDQLVVDGAAPNQQLDAVPVPPNADEPSQPMELDANGEEEFDWSSLENEPWFITMMDDNENSGLDVEQLNEWYSSAKYAKIRKSAPLSEYFLAVKVTLLGIWQHIPHIDLEMIDNLDEQANVAHLIQQNVGKVIGCALIGNNGHLAEEIIDTFKTLSSLRCAELASIKDKLDKWAKEEIATGTELKGNLWNLFFYAKTYQLLRNLLVQLKIDESTEDYLLLREYAATLVQFVDHVSIELNALVGGAKNEMKQQRAKEPHNDEFTKQMMVAKLMRDNECGAPKK